VCLLFVRTKGIYLNLRVCICFPGTISHHDMWDYLHLTKSGYSKAFEPVYDLLLQLLGEGEGINEKSGDELE